MNLKDKKIAVIGLGYVGLPLAVEFGKSRITFGFDINPIRVSELISGRDRTLEVDDLDLKNAKYLSFSSDTCSLISANIYIVTVPTPVDKYNQPDFSPLLSASELIAKFLKKDDIVIYESTVYPGCTEELCVPVLEKFSGLKFNVDFYCGYSPERINPGDKVNTLTKIKKVTSGSTPEICDVVDSLYASIIKAGTHKVSSIAIAEAAKVIENTQRDLNIAFVNELSVLFDRLNIDTIEVLEAAGTKWNFLDFRPGLVGGHCIGVDPYYLTYKAEEVGYHPQIITSGRRMNDNMAIYAVRKIIQMMIKNNIDISKSRVGVMGVTFKEDCSDIRNSKVIDLINEFKVWGIDVVAEDPYADLNEVLEEYGLKLNPKDDFKDLDALVVAVGHNVYRKITLPDIKKMFKSGKPVLADLKAIYNKTEALSLGLSVFRF
jgi:UDP-N-acetyl-D-galactosamine dehydrogenase